MTNPLQDVGLRLNRAEQHLQAIKAETAAFLQTYPYDVVYERNIDNVTHVFRVHGNAQPPRGLATIVGDFLYNCRTALDNLAWHLALKSGESEETIRNTAFPICNRKRSWESSGTAKKIKYIAPHDRAIIEWLQPFKRVEGGTGWPLWTLNELARLDRHRALHVAAGVQGGPGMAARRRDERGQMVHYPYSDLCQDSAVHERISVGSFEDKANIATFVITPPRPDVDMDCTFSFTVSLLEIERFGLAPGVPIDAHFEQMLRYLRREVLPLFKHSF